MLFQCVAVQKVKYPLCWQLLVCKSVQQCTDSFLARCLGCGLEAKTDFFFYELLLKSLMAVTHSLYTINNPCTTKTAASSSAWILDLPPVKTGNVLSDFVLLTRQSGHTHLCTCCCLNTHSLPLLPPELKKRPLHRGKSWQMLLSALDLSLVFWFLSPVLKMTEIVQGLGRLPRPG